MQAKPPKAINTKNTSESKRLEKENKRLQLELHKVYKSKRLVFLIVES